MTDGGNLSKNSIERLFGRQTNPYLIWAPRWIESSAGVRAMHYLSHAINEMGSRAFLVIAEPAHAGQSRLNPRLLAPELTSDAAKALEHSGDSPIAVYPEDVIGNPLNAPTVVRILWNYAGALGGPKSFPDADIIWAFSENIAIDYEKETGKKPRVLFVPPVDPREFSFSVEKKPYQVVYAGKYRSFVGKPFQVGSLPTIEIFRDGPKRQSRDEVKKLIQEAQVVYSFENSSIVTESILSGTPAGFIPNKFLGAIIAEKELGWGGSFLGDDAAVVDKARLTLNEGVAAYYKTIDDFQENLTEFISSTQSVAKETKLGGAIKLPSALSVVTINRILLSVHIIRTKGLVVFLKELGRFLRSQF